ncbi:hypothetical protein GYMLUDRAFT_247583 [Collybiopsis luxurians FD-317 M1]|uniref:DUF6534 domain-containing protein n=1 Tax=Collybiopsis luxurians FD-317 M1 TaxID=944289 RepID=A0A0D0B142_9AGAR|nr:hypothetical protein GYMLUDRAFT_247583 [Collybiopsis luxurians FD-317 M1]
MSTNSINDSLGAIYIAIVVAASLLGVSGLQGWHYFSHQKDSWMIQTLVAAILSFEFTSQALNTYTGVPARHRSLLKSEMFAPGFVYFVTFFQENAKLEKVVWSVLVELPFNGLTVLFIQSYWTYKIWKLSESKIWLISFVVSILFAEFASGIGLLLLFPLIVDIVTYVIFAFFDNLSFCSYCTFEELTLELNNLSIAISALTAFADLLITGILSLLLQSAKTGSTVIINKLILFTINTGALTSFCSLASLISILAAPNSFIYMAFFFAMGRVYSNSLLASLNARKTIRQAAEIDNTTTAAECSDNISPSHRENRNSELIFYRSKTSTIDNIRASFTRREHVSNLDSEMGINMEPAEEDLAETVLA